MGSGSGGRFVAARLSETRRLSARLTLRGQRPARAAVAVWTTATVGDLLGLKATKAQKMGFDPPRASPADPYRGLEPGEDALAGPTPSVAGNPVVRGVVSAPSAASPGRTSPGQRRAFAAGAKGSHPTRNPVPQTMTAFRIVGSSSSPGVSKRLLRRS